MIDVRKRYFELLKEEIFLVQLEEVLLKEGDFYEVISVRAERDQIYNERMALKQRMNFKVVGA